MSDNPTLYFDLLKQHDPAIYQALCGEQQRQIDGVELIPAENYTYPEVLALLGSVLTNKYSEGYPGSRYYGGQEFTDTIENIARDRARAVFGAAHANVQPLSGSPMNQAVYFALLQPGDTILAMELSHGGHLTHGAPVSHMGKVFNFVRYKTLAKTGNLDFDEIRRLAIRHKPKLILCGYSSYPRDLDYAQFKSIADEVGAYTMADISHIGGLVAGKVMNNPLDAGFDVVTTTTHKSLRGPRGGLILSSTELAKVIDKSVFPGLQGGPHMNQVAATAFTLLKAQQPEFNEYCKNVLSNTQSLAAALREQAVELITGGSENHLLVIDTVKSFSLNGWEAEVLLDRIGITVNKQVIPDDPLTPAKPSGIRIGSPAATTRGMDNEAMKKIARWMITCLRCNQNPKVLAALKEEVQQFCRQFPVPGL
jgi:glycine hydroxymethyltransferase